VAGYLGITPFYVNTLSIN